MILPAYVERTDGAHFVVRFLPPTDAGSSADVTAQLNASLAEPARRLIDQWIMLPSYRLRD